MARDVRDLGDLARGLREAFLAVNAAIPLKPEPVAGVVLAQATPQEEHLMTLREIAFARALDDRLDYEYYAHPADLAELVRGVVPAPGER